MAGHYVIALPGQKLDALQVADTHHELRSLTNFCGIKFCLFSFIYGSKMLFSSSLKETCIRRVGFAIS